MRRRARWLVTGLFLAGSLTAQPAGMGRSFSQWRDTLLDSTAAGSESVSPPRGKLFREAAGDAVAHWDIAAQDSLVDLLLDVPVSTPGEVGGRLAALALLGRRSSRARTWVLNAPKPGSDEGLRGWIEAMLVLDRFDLARGNLEALGDYRLLAEHPCPSAMEWMLATLTTLEGSFDALSALATGLGKLDPHDYQLDLDLSVLRQLDFSSERWSAATRLLCIRMVCREHVSEVMEELYLYTLNDSSPVVRSACAEELAKAAGEGDRSVHARLLDISELTRDPEVKRIAMNALLDVSDSTGVGR